MAEEKLQRSRKVAESAGKKTTCWSWEICWDNRLIIQKMFMLCLPCYVAREEFLGTMCEILSSAPSPICTKSLVTKRKPAVSQSWYSFSALVSSWSNYFKTLSKHQFCSSGLWVCTGTAVPGTLGEGKR